MIKELDTIALTVDLPEFGLTCGDLGIVVLEQRGESYEVEFVTLDGTTVAAVSLTAGQVRPIASGEIAHAREVRAYERV